MHQIAVDYALNSLFTQITEHVLQTEERKKRERKKNRNKMNELFHNFYIHITLFIVFTVLFFRFCVFGASNGEHNK